jgi:integrase
MARLYGTGSLWLRKSKRHPRGEWWIRFYDSAGRQRAENAHTCLCHQERSESKAHKLLAKRIGETEAGTLPGPQAKRTLVEDLAESLFKFQRSAMVRKIPESLPEPTRQWRERRAEMVLEVSKARWKKHLLPVFGHRKAALVTKADLDEYVTMRDKAGARNATINRELSLLHRMYRLGYESRPRLVSDTPKFPDRLVESARTGFIEDVALKKLLAAIKEPGLRGMTMVAYRLGFRKSELQNLLVMQVADGWIKLFAGATKNGKPRVVAMPDDVRKVVEACCARKAPDAHVFTWRDGSPILDFRSSWKKACQMAGVAGLRFHDLRRSTVRNMMRRGLSAAVAMRITGHLTRVVFDNYDVTAETDLKDAAKLL